MSPTSRPPRGLSRALAVGERVFLRRLVPSDESEYRELVRASRSFHRRWSPRPPRGVDPAGEEMFQHALKVARSKNGERMLICRREDGAILGSITLTNIVRGVFQSAFLGYWIGAPFQRQGYMTDALQLTLDHAFGPLNLHRVEANIRPENTASIALVKRAGFRFEGLARRYLKIDGKWCDHEHWALVAEERPRAARAKRRRRA